MVSCDGGVIVEVAIEIPRRVLCSYMFNDALEAANGGSGGGVFKDR